MTPALIEALLFYLFAIMTRGAAWFVVRAANPVHSVLYLIFAFFNTAALFLLLGAEFLAMIQIIVYVGAVAVLFLFVVMMLNINFTEIRENLARYWVIGFLLGMVLLAEIIAGISSYQYAPEAWRQAVANPIPGGVSNTEALGVLIYTDYIYAFQAAGLILLVAMIGAIVLTHRKRKNVKKQNITQQIRRTAKDAIEVKKIEPGEGV